MSASKKKKKSRIETGARATAQAARRATEAAWRSHPAHVLPGAKPAPKVNSAAFRKLQREWYGKLAKAELKKPEEERFTDIEWASNPDSPHIKQPSSRGRKLTPGKQLYFAMARNYLTHFRFRHRQEKVAWSMHTEGKSYREILEVLKQEFGIDKSIYWIFYYVKDIAAKCKQWNSENPEGLNNNAGTTFADDALLADPHMDECYSDSAEYGIPLDAGFWQSVPKKD